MKQNETQVNEQGSLTTLLTVAEAAMRLKVTRGHLYNQIHAGKLIPDGWYKGRFPRFKPETLDATIESKRRGRAPRTRRPAHGA